MEILSTTRSGLDLYLGVPAFLVVGPKLKTMFIENAHRDRQCSSIGHNHVETSVL